jgi:type IV pilus assembly protein PilV
MSAHPKSAQQGMMLIEALVGILIFSIGILAMLGMQSVGIQTTVDAKFRSDAAFLANELISQIWVDQAHLTSYSTSGGPYAPRDAWVAEVQSRLPQSSGGNAPQITVIGSPTNQVKVTLYWQEPGEPTRSQQIVMAQIKGASSP